MFKLTKTHTLINALSLGGLAVAQGSLWIDFNSNQAGGGDATPGSPELVPTVNHEAGYESYWTNHESADHLNPATAGSYTPTFANSGATSVTVLPAWEDTSGNNVRQSIGRSDGQAGSWLGHNQNLLRDWIGIDSRPVGTWDGTNGTPTYLTLTLGGLPADTYNMTTFHHDVENMNAIFTTEVSTDGGLTFGSSILGRMTKDGIPESGSPIRGNLD